MKDSKEDMMDKANRMLNRILGLRRRVDPATVEGPVYAGFHDRVFAAVIDTSIIYFICLDLFEWLTDFVFKDMPPLLQSFEALGGTYYTQNEMIRAFVDHLFASGFFQYWIVNSFFQSLVVGVLLIGTWIQFGTTPGKWLLGLEYVDDKTQTLPTPRQFFIRYLGFYLSMPVFMIGFAAMIFSSKKQTWHDKIAGTAVIYSKRGSIFRRGYRAAKTRLFGKPVEDKSSNDNRRK